MKRIGFAYNPTNSDALELRDRGMGWCSRHGIDAWAAPAGDSARDGEALVASDAIVVLGGDGTFLRAARIVAEVDTPIIGINLGKVGFLSKAEHHDLEDVLELLLDGAYELEPRMALEARVFSADGHEPSGPHIALNEAAIVRGAHARVLRARVDVGDSHVATYVCDGIVVASPTGSTGYSFSAGGPIIEPTSRSLVVTPIAAYLTPLRSNVVGPQHVVRVKVIDAHDSLVSIDGYEDIPLEVGDVVEVRARVAPIRFIQPRGALPFWDLLRQKAALLPE
ncbi:MAG: NAD(+)/NADH kinase [Chloroflexota bacterium]